MHSEIDAIKNENEYLKSEINDLIYKLHRTNEKATVYLSPTDQVQSHMHNLVFNMDATKYELNNTRQVCNQVLSMDYKKMENIKLKFDEIKANLVDSSEKSCTYRSVDDDICDDKEHLEVLRYDSDVCS